jgi:cytochrome c-type biogenesis protein CcmE
MSDNNDAGSNAGPIFLVGALAVAGTALGVVFFAADEMGESITYFWDPTQVVEAGAAAVGPDIRLGGMVEEGSLTWNESDQVVTMTVTDTHNSLPVRCEGAPPQMLREGIGVVVEGTMTEAGTFDCDRLLVKHSNEYKAATEDMSAEERKALYKTVEGYEGL